jgi:hypothetical protein
VPGKANPRPGNWDNKRIYRIEGYNRQPLAIPQALIDKRAERMVEIILEMPPGKERRLVMETYASYRVLYYNEDKETARAAASALVSEEE